MIRVENLTVRVGTFSLEGVDLVVEEGEYAVLMGKTGSGKTTLLETIAGLTPVAGGRIMLGDEDVTHQRPNCRGVGYVPQDGAIFPTMSVRNNLAFALFVRCCDRATIDRRVHELAELLSIEHLLGRMPAGLSGGERQRVALGRALAFHPSVLLLDEPLSALDEETRQRMYALLREVRQATHVTTLHVTHNRNDAVALDATLFRIEAGRVQRNGRPP